MQHLQRTLPFAGVQSHAAPFAVWTEAPDWLAALIVAVAVVILAHLVTTRATGVKVRHGQTETEIRFRRRRPDKR